MTSSEYKNTIEWTLKHSDENSDPEKVRVYSETSERRSRRITVIPQKP